MKGTKFALAACAAALSLTCFGALFGCSSQGGSSSVALTGGVAATVNGVEISEDDVTMTIEQGRVNLGATDDETWANWLNDQGYTVESLREEIIESMVTQELIRQGAEERGITVDPAQVDEYVNEMKAYYDDSDQWNTALETIGMTEEEYRDSISDSLLIQSFQSDFTVEDDPTEEDMLEYAQMYASYYDGAKKSSHVLFNAEDTALAQEVLDKLNSGELDIATAAEQYSQDTGSAAQGGDVGWDKLTSFVTEYQTALDGLEKGQISDLVTSTYGIHIIECTDVFTAPEEVTSTSQLPEEFVEQIKELVKNNMSQQAYNDWLTEARENADVVINAMPEGLPYYVDITLYVTANENGNVSDESGDVAGDASDTSAGSTEGESSEGEGSSDASDASATSGQPAEVTDGE